MILKWVTEIILTSCLLWSRVWCRPSYVCDSGRGEWDKWFDGCRWCVCLQSGHSCSSSECSHLVSRVPPCQKVDSRWWDGCYHCKCYHHGIECTVDDTCLMLLRSDPNGLDFLSRDACVNPQDGRCVCGIDGVPSCTAEVIDRKAHRSTTIGLRPVVPAASAILSPRHVYYERPFTNTRRDRADTPDFFTDSLYINDPDGAVEKRRNGQFELHRHSLVKRHASRNKKHSPQVYITKRRRSKNTKHKSAVETRHSSSHNRRTSRKHFRENLLGKRSHGRRQVQDGDKNYVRENSNNVFDSDLINSIRDNQFYPKKKCRESYSSNNVASSNRKMDKSAYKDRFRTFQSVKRKDRKNFIRVTGLNVDRKFKTTTAALEESASDERFLNDGTAAENLIDNSSSALLLVASSNRCRWGVRWYGGSLRCYCGMENSITCGDPSFVASRVDGFRLERASCDVGQVWDDAYSCRSCECQKRGVVLCMRSPSCPLPFLIEPLPVDPDEGSYDRRIDDYNSGKDQNSIGNTDEFTGQEEQKVVYDKDTETTSQGEDDKDGREKEEVDVYINQESDNTTIVNISNGKMKNDSELEKPNLITGIENNGDETGLRNGSEDGGFDNSTVEADYDNTDGNNKKDVLELDIVNTTYPGVIITQEGNSTIGDVNINLERDDDNKSQENVEKTTNNKLDAENKDFKRTTQKILGDCAPSRRWMDGCKRCRCDNNGVKHCDDSRCLKPITINPNLMKIPPKDGNSGSGRPMVRPPPEWFVPRKGPINLKPPFLDKNLCGRFKVGQKYWDECNICWCTPQGPKCTAKNCV